MVCVECEFPSTEVHVELCYTKDDSKGFSVDLTVISLGRVKEAGCIGNRSLVTIAIFVGKYSTDTILAGITLEDHRNCRVKMDQDL